MSLDPIQLDYRRLQEKRKRRTDVIRFATLPWVFIALGALVGLGLTLFLYYIVHP